MNFGKLISNAAIKAMAPKISDATQPVKNAAASAAQPAATVTETVKKTVTPAPAATAKTNAPSIPTFSRKSLGFFGRRGFANGGSVGSASKRADGIAQRGKTKGKMV